VDNGAPWGCTGGLATAFTLWLVGLGVDVSFNHPGRPQQNGVVERGQGTGKSWGEPHTCASPGAFQKRMDELDEVQRARYPRPDGRSRAAAFPGLAHSGRAYDPQREEQAWDLGRALAFLADLTAERRVGADGKVSLYDRPRSVGRAWAGQVVYVTLDAETREWVVSAADGRTARRLRADELSRERIVSLTVARSRPDREAPSPESQ
jgi:hypothetical protein